MIRLWLIQHGQALRLVLARMWRNRLSTLMMLGVMGVSLSLPALLGTVIDNLTRFSGELRLEPQISLFMRVESTPDQVDAIRHRLEGHAGVATHRFVPRDEAWQALQASSGFQEVTSGLKNNPLPDAFVILPKAQTPEAVQQLHDDMRTWPEVEHVQVDADWVKRLYAVVELGHKVVFVLFGLLGFALMAVVGNTIRLQIMTQREEIEVSKLIGATDRFIRRPFLYAGALYGFGGGIAAWVILSAVLWLFNLTVQDIAALYGADFMLHMQPWDKSLLLLASAVLLGWVGAFLAVTRALSELETS